MSGSHVVRFGVFELDGRSGELRRHGLKIRLPDQSFQILKQLLSRPGEVVSREDLRRALWTSETFVDFEVGLNSAVRKLREALDDSAENPRFIETLPRRGYRFIASVSEPEGQPQIPVALPPPLITETPVTAAAAVVPGPALASPPAAVLTSRRFLWSRAAGLLLVALIATAAVIGYYASDSIGLGAGPAPMRALVVLPFDNLTGNPAQDYLADSVTDAITAHLAQVNGIDVISPTSAAQYRRTTKKLPEIGRELNVDGAVAGTVRTSGEGLSITVRLHRPETDTHVWSQTYQAGMGQMLAVQQRIASDIVVAAGRPELPPAARGGTRVVAPAAYDAYLNGLKAMGLQRAEGFRRGVAYFEEAVAIQPDFAEAHAVLAQTQMQFLFGGPLSPHQVIPKAETAARRAIQLDPTLAMPHRVLGQILCTYYWRCEEGDRELQRAVELQQGNREDLSTVLANSFIRQHRFADAIAASERARKLDPLSLNPQIAVATAYRAAGQHDRAINELRQALQMSPGHNRVHFQLGVTFVAMGRLDDAIRELEIAARPAHGHNSRIEAYLGYAYAAARRPEDARKVLRELEAHRREQYVSWFGIALIHDALGDTEPALAAIQRAYEDHAVEFAQIEQYPRFRTIAAEPGFRAIMRQVGVLR